MKSMVCPVESAIVRVSSGTEVEMLVDDDSGAFDVTCQMTIRDVEFGWGNADADSTVNVGLQRLGFTPFFSGTDDYVAYIVCTASDPSGDFLVHSYAAEM